MNGLSSIGPLMLQRLVCQLAAAARARLRHPRRRDPDGYRSGVHARDERPGSAGVAREADRQLQPQRLRLRRRLPLGDPENARDQQELAQVMSEEIGWFSQAEVRYGAMDMISLTVARPAESRPARRALDPDPDALAASRTTSSRSSGRFAKPTTNPNQMEVVMPIRGARSTSTSRSGTRFRAARPSTTATGRRQPRTRRSGRRTRRSAARRRPSCSCVPRSPS